MKNAEVTRAMFNLAVLLSAKHDDEDVDVCRRYMVFATNIPFNEVLEGIDELPEDYRL